MTAAQPHDPNGPAAAHVAEAQEVLGHLSFRNEWRKYQRMILELFEQRDPAKRTFHIVAPPGSGKTLVGIEIARRIGRPAVTFSPTTTIQEQWQDKVRLFLPADAGPDEAGRLLGAVSGDPSHLGVISSLTYQSLSTQTQEREFLDRLGRQAWLDELVEGGRSEEAAVAHLARVAERSASVYRRGVALRARRRKREVLEGGEARLEQLLHPNALDLVERIVGAGTGCIILDEAHHLLDYWAAILAHLIGRLPDALVLGLTATPPASAAAEELENYLTLVNGIDFEVPTPAVVRSGYLAPYQDLAYVTRPTSRERQFVADAERRVLATAEQVAADSRYLPRLAGLVNGEDGRATRWLAFLDDDFDLAIAAVRTLLEAGLPLGPGVEVVPEMRRPPDLRDRLALVRDWAMDVLRLSADPADELALADLQVAMRTVGLLMTETGWRRTSSPIDRVLAYSESKVDGMIRILEHEGRAMGPELRAVVLTDFERASVTAERQLRGVLDPESGGAIQSIRALVRNEATNELDPAMVTGRTVIVDSSWRDGFLTEAATFFESRGLRAQLTGHEVEPGLTLIDGSGPDWRPRYYVACLTDLFERGITRCLVGTRGLLAEGWDTLRLNTLVDLTTAGTFASVNQIRGRTIRLDPAQPRKVANNWDVVCHEPDLEGGGRDLERLIGKHEHVWGLAPGGRIVRGVNHVDGRLGELGRPHLPGEPRPTAAEINSAALGRAARRDKAYDDWGVGRPYDNFLFRATVLAPQVEQVKTAFSWAGSLRAMLQTAFAVFVFYVFLIWSNGLQLLVRLSGLPQLLATLIVLVAPLVIAAPFFWRYLRAAFIHLPLDSYLADFGRAVAQALRSTGLAPATTDQVRVVERDDGTYSVYLDNRDAAAVERFARSYQELFAPIVNQRYLVIRDESSLAAGFYRPAWYVARSLFRFFRRRKPYYHPVPSAFERKRELADQFAAAWKAWVGGGDLVYTRSPKGLRILLRERAEQRLKIASAGVEEWR